MDYELLSKDEKIEYIEKKVKKNIKKVNVKALNTISMHLQMLENLLGYDETSDYMKNWKLDKIGFLCE